MSGGRRRRRGRRRKKTLYYIGWIMAAGGEDREHSLRDVDYFLICI
jgi:hypothetical protein